MVANNSAGHNLDLLLLMAFPFSRSMKQGLRIYPITAGGQIRFTSFFPDKRLAPAD
jgi:hypothetical protein